MAKTLLILLFLFLFAGCAFAQFGSHDVLYVAVAPSGSCAAGVRLQVLINGAGTVYACQSIVAGTGTWTALASGGATGTVTSVGLAGTANQITVTGSSPITLSGSWTLSFPSAVTLPGTLTVTGNTTTNMSGGPFCVRETSGLLSATTADCGGGINITVNGGSNLATPINFQNGSAVTGITINASNPSGSNVQFAISGTLTNAGLSNSVVTSNGQTCTLGSTCNVNVGATAHGVALNEGNGSAISGTAVGTTGIPLIGQTGADPVFGTAVVGGGGTGATTLTAHGVLLGQGTSAVTATAAGTQYQFLQVGATDPGWSSWKVPATGGTNAQCLTSNGTDAVWGSCSTGAVGTGGGTVNAIAKFTAASTINNSLLTDTGTLLSYTGTGGLQLTAGPLELTEIVAPSGVASNDFLYGDSTAHRLKVNNNNGGATTLAVFTDNLSVFAATTSAQLAGVLSDETGTGVAVFATSPAFTTDLHCATVGGCTLGTAALPASSVYIGGAATNNINLTGTATAARTITLPNATGGVALDSSSDTTTSDVLHATATGHIYTASAIATGDLPTIPIAGGGTNATSAAAGQVPNTTSSSASSWTATPTLGIAGTTAGSLTLTNSAAAEGSLIMTGHTSGTVTVKAQAVTGTPAILWPNTSGTVATTATAPVVLSATTGVISITGAAGQVLAGASPGFTATPTLGVVSTTTGTLAFANSGNTGVMTLTPASGTVAATVTIPDVTGTLLSSGTTVTVAQGGTGATTLTQYGVLLGEATGAIQATAAGTQYQFLISNGSANPGWSSWQLPSTGGSNNQCLTSNGTNGVWGACTTGSVTGSSLVATQVAVAASSSSITSYAGFTSDSSGNVTAASVTISNANPGIAYLGQGTTPWGLGTTSIGLGAPTTVTSYNPILPSAASAGTNASSGNFFLKFGTSQNQTGCTASATNLCGYYESTIGLSAATGDVSGVLPAVNGGSGISSPTAHTVLVGEGSSPFGTISVGPTGTVLIGATGADPSFSTALSLGNASTTGSILINGKTSGVISLIAQDTAGTYNWNWPTTAGSANQCLTSQGGGASVMTWASCGGALSGITAASAANTLANGNWPQVWNWAQTTVSQSAFTFGETSAATGSGDIELNVQTLSASTALPIQITSRGTANGVYMTVAGLLESMGTGKIQADTLTSCCGTSGNILVSAGAGATPNGVSTLSYSSPTLTINPTTAGSNSIVAITPTWNNGSITFPGALLVNPTNTGSATGSLLADFQLGSTSQWKLDKVGNSTQLGSATIVGLTDNVALTGSGTGATIGESTAATGASNAIAYITTLTTSSAIPLQITQGAAGPTGANAPALINISAAAAGGAASSHTGYVGAPITLITGAGGAANGTANAGGIGGAFGLTVGNGGAGGATGAGGAGGAIALGSGNGAAGGGTSGTGGVGGAIGFTAGYGGAQVTSGTGGAGGSLTLTAGAGGNGATAGGSGGSVTLTPGAAGTGGTGTAGSVIITGMSSGVVQSSSGTLSASTTLPTGLSATNLTLVTPALGTPTSGTLTTVTGYVENNLTGAAAAGTITEGGATYSVTRAGIATANLTAPWVFQNTNSSNSNTSITMGITAPGTSSGQTVLNVNGASTSGDLTDWGTGGTWTAGVLSGQTIVASVLPTGAFQAKGTTAGFVDLPQGTTSAAVAPCNAATSICIQAPTSVTSQLRILAGTPATGFSLFTNSTGTMTETISAVNGTISAGTGLFGTTAVSAVLAETVAPIAGHFTSITVTTVLGGTCSTQPQFNVFDGTSNTGTAVTGSASTQTKGTGTTQAETQTFAGGDHIGIYISTGGATCTTDVFTVSAQYTTP
jgi:hypothetical protein